MKLLTILLLLLWINCISNSDNEDLGVPHSYSSTSTMYSYTTYKDSILSADTISDFLITPPEIVVKVMNKKQWLSDTVYSSSYYPLAIAKMDPLNNNNFKNIYVKNDTLSYLRDKYIFKILNDTCILTSTSSDPMFDNFKVPIKNDTLFFDIITTSNNEYIFNSLIGIDDIMGKAKTYFKISNRPDTPITKIDTVTTSFFYLKYFIKGLSGH